MARRSPADVGLSRSPLWFREAIIYEIPIRAFSDSNGDGIGDFAGLVSKLDYLQDLGVTAIWVLPFYPSPLRDGGYDIADYTTINPIYGDLEDFRRLMREAHKRDIRVITELVINHTSKDHPWFQRARTSPPGSKHRDYYVWSDTPDRYADARIIFKDFETSNWTWDPVAKAYYWHRFYSHQPDLNFDNPAVEREVLRLVDHWLDMGVDGMRLDAVPYLYEREGTNCENLEETHAVLKRLRAHVDRKYKDRMLLAEANQWPEDAAAYFGRGDQCHMNFHFPLMPRMFMSVQLEDRFPIVDILRQTPAIPDTCQWATFLRNHDELTLEMVTDEDRDYMYRVYAEDPTARINLGIRRRLAPLLKSRQKIELMNGLLFSLPGTPVIYYGDEIGMGDNIYLGDRDGVRTPMQWSGDRNAGFSSANPQRLYLPVITDPEYHYEAVNVEAQQHNPASLLWWMKRIIGLVKRHRVFGTGSLEFLHPDNSKILAYTRTLGEERVLVVANLSRSSQFVELDLTAYRGMVPVEMFGNVRFPAISDRPYLLSLTPHSFFWFLLEAPAAAVLPTHDELPLLDVEESWTALLEAGRRKALEAVLHRDLGRRRWFRSKGRPRKTTTIIDVVPLAKLRSEVQIALLRVDYAEGDPETYVLPTIFHAGERAAEIEARLRHAAIARVRVTTGEGQSEGVLFDAAATGEVAGPLLEAIRGRTGLPGAAGGLQSMRTKSFDAVAGPDPLPVRTPELEQSNSTLLLGDRVMLKLYRQIAPGPNPEVEIGVALARKGSHRIAPRVLGAVEYKERGREPASFAIAQELIQNEGDAWRLTLSELDRYFERVLTGDPTERPPERPASLLQLSRTPLPPAMREKIGSYAQRARLLGQRTAEMHLALAAAGPDAAFAPEPFSTLHQRSIYQWSHTRLARTFEELRKQLQRLPEATRALAAAAVAEEKTIDDLLKRIFKRKLQVQRIRTHGDLHLGQVLSTGDDFIIIDFEGEPARPLNERRYKRGALRDAMGMIRSFGYAAISGLRGGRVRSEDIAALQPWADAWAAHVSGVYLCGYLQTIGDSPLLPPGDADRELLLQFYELEKVIYEVGYELHNRPDWLAVPLEGLLAVVSASRKA
jgi:maltose alpha-D-glucosyltransferase / alpha-amylase